MILRLRSKDDLSSVLCIVASTKLISTQYVISWAPYTGIGTDIPMGDQTASCYIGAMVLSGGTFRWAYTIKSVLGS